MYFALKHVYNNTHAPSIRAVRYRVYVFQVTVRAKVMSIVLNVGEFLYMRSLGEEVFFG
jgi:hypothetical protein